MKRKKKKKQKCRYDIVEIDKLLKRLEINNVIMIHEQSSLNINN